MSFLMCKTIFIREMICGRPEKNIGAVKVCLREEEAELDICLCNLSSEQFNSCEVSFCLGRNTKKLGDIEVWNGNGRAQFILAGTECDDIGEGELCILISANRCGRCSFNAFQTVQKNKNREATRVLKEEQLEELEFEGEGTKKEKHEREREELERRDFESEEFNEALTEIADENEQGSHETFLCTTEERWKQLQSEYPVFYPFEGQGAYISLRPCDLSVLSPTETKMAHNSFLQHAYYEYHHLIFGKYNSSNESHFYLGVPGTFLEREQMIADMFGFEGYEYSGDYGYYMKRVKW